MISPIDADRALCALKYSREPNVCALSNFLLIEYFAQLAKPVLAVQQAATIASQASKPEPS